MNVFRLGIPEKSQTQLKAGLNSATGAAIREQVKRDSTIITDETGSNLDSQKSILKEIDTKQGLLSSITNTIQKKESKIGAKFSLAARIGLTSLKKSVRAQ